MSERDRVDLYNDIWDQCGSDAQLDICVEEMAEFTQAILKARRNGVVFSYAFFEEMADVMICLEQIEERLKGMLAWEQVQEIKNKKLYRLKKRFHESRLIESSALVNVFDAGRRF